MAVDGKAVFRLVSPDEGCERTLAEIDESVASLAVEPVPVHGLSGTGVRGGGVVSFRPVIRAVQDKRLGETLFLEEVQSPVHRDLIHQYAGGCVH